MCIFTRVIFVCSHHRFLVKTSCLYAFRNPETGDLECNNLLNNPQEPAPELISETVIRDDPCGADGCNYAPEADPFVDSAPSFAGPAALDGFDDSLLAPVPRGHPVTPVGNTSATGSKNQPATPGAPLRERSSTNSGRFSLPPRGIPQPVFETRSEPARPRGTKFNNQFGLGDYRPEHTTPTQSTGLGSVPVADPEWIQKRDVQWNGADPNSAATPCPPGAKPGSEDTSTSFGTGDDSFLSTR